MTAIASSGGGAHRIQASAVRGWPALLLALVVLGAAWYAFSPRPLPPFPATRVFPNKLLLNDIARDGSRLIAVGEQGVILLADDPHGPWRQVNVSPQRGSTLTRVGFVDKNTALAVGHDDWIVRSEDNGQTWKEVSYNKDEDQAAPLFGVAGPFDGKVYAFGAFGTLMQSPDLGKTWQSLKSDAIGDKHLYGMLQGDGGVLLLVGEQGEMLRSADGGKTWQPLKQIYKGSFFGALALPDKSWLVYGMRGHVFYSKDAGPDLAAEQAAAAGIAVRRRGDPRWQGGAGRRGSTACWSRTTAAPTSPRSPRRAGRAWTRCCRWARAPTCWAGRRAWNCSALKLRRRRRPRLEPSHEPEPLRRGLLRRADRPAQPAVGPVHPQHGVLRLERHPRQAGSGLPQADPGAPFLHAHHDGVHEGLLRRQHLAGQSALERAGRHLQRRLHEGDAKGHRRGVPDPGHQPHPGVLDLHSQRLLHRDHRKRLQRPPGSAGALLRHPGGTQSGPQQRQALRPDRHPGGQRPQGRDDPRLAAGLRPGQAPGPAAGGLLGGAEPAGGHPRPLREQGQVRLQAQARPCAVQGRRHRGGRLCGLRLVAVHADLQGQPAGRSFTGGTDQGRRARRLHRGQPGLRRQYRGQRHRLRAPAGRRDQGPARRVQLLRPGLPHHPGPAALVHALAAPDPGRGDRGPAAGAVADRRAAADRLRHRPDVDPGAVPDLLHRRLPRGADDQCLAPGSGGRGQLGRGLAPRLPQVVRAGRGGAADQRPGLRGDHVHPDPHRARAGHHRLPGRAADDRHQQDDPALHPAHRTAPGGVRSRRRSAAARQEGKSIWTYIAKCAEPQAAR